MHNSESKIDPSKNSRNKKIDNHIINLLNTIFVNRSDCSKVVVIPKKLRELLGEENTDLFIVKIDEKQRIILEPIKKVTPPAGR